VRVAPLVHLGLRPAYITPRYDQDLGVPLQVTPAQVCAALDAHPDARALVLTYPNYFGIAAHTASRCPRGGTGSATTSASRDSASARPRLCPGVHQ
jgi:hypothetical protein